jgi:hypothetical protein
MAWDDCAFDAHNDVAITARATPKRRQLKATAEIKRLVARATLSCASIPNRLQEEVPASKRLEVIGELSP